MSQNNLRPCCPLLGDALPPPCFNGVAERPMMFTFMSCAGLLPMSYTVVAAYARVLQPAHCSIFRHSILLSMSGTYY